MQTKADEYLSQLKSGTSIRRGLRQTLPVLSLLVVMGVFWGLKLTGITMAGEAFCGFEEHVHSEQCPLQNLICTLEESEAHIHSEACILQEQICTLEEIPPHTHAEDCRTPELICSLQEQEGHTHNDSCTVKVRICEQNEFPAHTHSSSCYQQNLSCQFGEDPLHTHADSCYTLSLACAQDETAGHRHEDACYTVTEEYGCRMEESEGHTHAEECYLLPEGFTCGLEETEGHAHTPECFRSGIGFGCGLAESDGHIHTEECITEQTQFGCGLVSTEGHAHSDGCYDILDACPLEEHIHTENCYSDITADLETEDDWEMTLAGLERSHDMAENVIAVAHSQLGYTESTLNFQVDAEGVRRGITRYGQWYGNPYGDWSAMFTAFCLHYAGVQEFPANAGADAMLLQWQEADMYKAAAEYTPKAGNVLFLDKDGNGTADATAIITDFQNDEIAVIEGDIDNAVVETLYSAYDTTILGYGLIPSESELYVLGSAAPAGAAVIARTTAYSPSMFTDEHQFVVYTASGSDYYAFDGSGNAVLIYIDAEGKILTDSENADSLLWTFSSAGNNAYLIQNVATGRYMHAFANNGGGVTTSGAYNSTLIQTSQGINIRSNSTDYARLVVSAGNFQSTQNQNLAADYQFGITQRCTVWLDGTNGGLRSLGGSVNRSYSVARGEVIQLPTQWQTPDKYGSVIQGWYDVINSRYYPPGAEVTVEENLVFYADWVASTYDIGQYNSHVTDTVSTSDFITTHLFDYNYLFNVQSQNVTTNVNASGHTENWSLVSGGNVPFRNQPSLDFIFIDYDAQRRLTYPSNNNSRNTSAGVHSGLYTPQLGYVLFGTDNSFDPNTGTGVLGKKYLGTGDHLFQFMDDPNHELYGYYYYDSRLNAASYNRSARRFYVYDYLEATSDSLNSSIPSDFLPVNSPYANTNGKATRTYSYDGVYGEYAGVNHIRYDACYSDNNNSPNYVATNYAFGMSMDVRFYLQASPGDTDENGEYRNVDLYGQQMHFKFSGDDDVWVLVDGRLALDLGGIHGVESGDINFTTGDVTVNGTVTGNVKYLTEGDHTLTVQYLERGSSMSNCAIYFNLAPRFSFSIQKEDVLTRSVLNGAQFTVYTDRNCTQPATLWVSEASHDRGDSATSTFTVTDGVAHMWGMSPGTKYYIKETRPPDDADYTYAHGVICITIDKLGVATYDVELTEEINPDGSTTDVSQGFTVHGIRIDEETQSAYIVATNAPSWVKETTSIQVRKEWKDNLDHSGEWVTVYLTYTDQEGNEHRIREIQLGDDNNWTHIWENMPKYFEDGVTPIPYSVDESYRPGYSSTVEKDYMTVSNGYTWLIADSIEPGETYIFSTPNGCLSTYSRWNHNLRWVSMDTAKNSSMAKWTAEWVEDYACYRFINGYGAVLTSHSSDRYFYATTSNVANQCLAVQTVGSGVRIFAPTGSGNFFFQNMQTNNTGRANATTNSADAMVFTPYVWGEQLEIIETDNWLYKVVNTPLDEETAMTVTKQWVIHSGDDPTLYQEAQVTVRLLANGRDTGRTVTLNLKNNWTATFRGLPYTDDNDNVIVYTVEESWNTEDWIPTYGEIIINGGDPPTYSTTVTNTYRWGNGTLLPSTGSPARLMYTLCGGSIMLASLVYGFGTRRKRERRMK